MNARRSAGSAVVFVARMAVCIAALGVAGCASRGARGARRGEGIAAHLGDRVVHSPSAAALAERRAAGASGLPRLATLNRETSPTPQIESSWPAPPPVGQYGPVGESGAEPPPWPQSSGCSGAPGEPCLGPGYAVGGAAYFGTRTPHDPGTDSTGLAGAVQGASAYRNPGEGDGAAHRPGTATGTGVYEKTLEAERRVEAPPPSSAGSDRHGR